MLDATCTPVWFPPVPTNVVASNLEAQTYEGKPVLSWWQGDVTATGEINSGEDVVVNQHYQRVATLKGADGWVLTLHSMVIQGHDAWVTANKNVRADLSGYGGVNNGVLVDSAVQEYDLRTGKLLYTLERARTTSRRRTPTPSRRPTASRGTPTTSTRSAVRQRHVPRLDAQHLGRLPGQHHDRQDPLDARRQALELHHPEPAPRSSGSTTPSCTGARP